jgi:hypothetical protein
LFGYRCLALNPSQRREEIAGVDYNADLKVDKVFLSVPGPERENNVVFLS